MTTHPERLSIAFADGIAQVRLTRTDKLNAVDQPMFESIAAAHAELAAMKGLRAVVLAGEGRGFCAGIDLSRFGQGERVDTLVTRSHGLANLVQTVAIGWRALPVPVIAAVHGMAFGAGFQIMLGADIRIAAPDTRFAIMEGKWGLVPDMAGIALTRTLARDDVLRELTYTAREFTAEEALGYGFVTRVDADPLARATELAQAIAARSPDAVRAAKRLFNAAPDQTLGEILQAETDEQLDLIGGANQMEAVMAGMQKRAPNFSDV